MAAARTKPPLPAFLLLILLIPSTLLTTYAATTPTPTAAITTTTPPTPTRAPDCPKQCACTDNNLTVDCSHRGLFRVPASLSPLTVRLDLSGNLLGPMINGSLERLRQLRQVDLSGNGFLRLQLCTFTGLLHLRRVDLHGNRLRGLPSSLFADNGEMEVLDLSHNELDALPDLLLHTLPHLKVLNVSHNRATYLKLGLRFQLLTQLRVLDLSHNPFTNASQDAFEMAETWDHQVPRSLDLSHCQLRAFHPNALPAVPGLRNLSLAGNRLLSFQQVVDVLRQLETSGLEVVDLSNMSVANPGLFSEVRLMALRELDLSENLIATVPAASFGNIRSLRKLDISGNLLTALDAGFEDLVNLVELNISRCRLSSFKGSPVGRMQELTSLDLSHNRLLETTEVDLSALRKLRKLDLSYNTLQSLVLPGDCSHLESVNLDSNALTSLPSMPNMRSLRVFSAYDNNLQSLSAFLFTEASRIALANFSQNDLTNIDHRAFLPASPRVIDLSHNDLTRTQFFSWTTTEEVYLHDNKLNDLDQQTFYGMDRLRILDLRHNNLSAIHDETFKFLSNLTALRLSNNSLQMSDFFRLFRSLESLRQLDLGFNLIEELNVTSFQPLVSLLSLSLRRNRMRVVPAELFQHLEKLAEVDISGNPFDCGCDLLPLQDWLRKTTIRVRQRYDLNLTNTCASPPEHRGKQVAVYTVERFQCNVKLLYLIIFGSVGGLGIVVGIVSSLVCHYYSKWRRAQRGGHPWKAEWAGAGRGAKKKKKKEKESSRVDLVRVSKRSDPFGKQELVNGWVASKRLAVAGKNPEPHHDHNHHHSDKKHHHHHHHHNQQGPPRPPWPERLSGRSQREEKGQRDRPKRDGHHSRRDSSGNDNRRVRSVSEMVPLRVPSHPHAHSQQQLQRARPERAHSLEPPLWDERYREKYPPLVVNLRRAPDRWEDAAAASYRATWTPAPVPVRAAAYEREGGRFYTLPYPALWPRYPPYGPDYPYRRRLEAEREQERAVAAAAAEEELRRPVPSHESRALLPYPPRNPADFLANGGGGDPRPPPERRSSSGQHPSQQHAYSHSPYPANRHHREYENVREGRERREEREERVTRPELSRDRSHDRREYDDDGRRDEGRHGEGRGDGGRRGAGEEGRGSAEERSGPPAMRRGTSDVQIHRRDSEYRNAMDNPIGPKAVSSPMLAEDKASDWL